jgi:hypothetical protein
MDDNITPNGPQLPDLDQLTTWILSVLPYTDSQLGSRPIDWRTRVIQALKIVLIAREEAALELKKMLKPHQQKAAELDRALEQSSFKTFTKSKDANDLKTALGYVQVKWNFKKYKTPEALHKAVLDAGITTKAETVVRPDIRARTSINLGETVSTAELDRFVTLCREKDSKRKRVSHKP